eukprot:4801798-Alexandrium_andersonii.AAC.1
MQHGGARSASYTNSSRCVVPHVRHNSPRARNEWKMVRGGSGEASHCRKPSHRQDRLMRPTGADAGASARHNHRQD